MDIPFSPEQFLNLFETYNHFIQPLQIIAYILGLLSILFLFRKNKITPKIITGILATFWIWIGFFYHILFFSSINKAAYLFGSLFIIQGFFFMYTGIIRRKLDFHIEWNITTISGFIIILYAMIIYPILNILLGHSYPRMPVFGVTPCPTTIFTFGFILFIKNKMRTPQAYTTSTISCQTYFIWPIISNIGIYIAIIIPPIMIPINTMTIGSINEVKADTAASTSSS